MARSFRFNVALTCILMLLCSVAAGDEPVQPSLPAPGSWARYHITIQNDEVQEQSSISEIRFLDRVMENNQPCVWIEFVHWHPTQEQAEYFSVTKYLIPEQELLTGTQPIRRSVRYHSLEKSDGEVIRRERNPDRDLRLGHAMSGPYLQAILGRRSRGTISPKMVHVDYQLGRLTCTQTLRGSIEELEVAERPHMLQSFDSVCEFRLHDDVPTGFAEAKISKHVTNYLFDPPMDPIIAKEGTLTWTLMDFGTGAKSELPEKN